MTSRHLTLLLLINTVFTAEAMDIRGNFQSRYALGLETKETSLFEQQLNIEVESSFGNGKRFFSEIQLSYEHKDTLEPGLPDQDSSSGFNRRDFYGDNTELMLREFYLDGYVNDIFYRVGKQAIVWGQADGLQVLDVVNPQNYREFIWQDQDQRRIPLWSATIEFPLHEWTAQLLWIPDQTYHRLPMTGANAAFEFTSPIIRPSIPAGYTPVLENADKPDNFFGDSDWGLRLSAFLNGWDISLHYLYHYLDTPIFTRTVRALSMELTPTYTRSYLAGASFSNAFGNFTFRGELAYSTDRAYLLDETATIAQITDTRGLQKSNELASVLGIDYSGFSDTLLSAQLFNSVIDKHRDDLIRDKLETQASLLVRRDYLNNRLNLELLAVHSLDNHDGSVQLSLDYDFRSNIILRTGLDAAYGNNDGLFGQFDNQDRWFIGLEIGF